MFGGLDVIVIMIVLGGILGGAGRGFLGTIIDIFGIAAGIFIGSFVYPAPVKLFSKFGITGTAVDLIFFILSSIFFALSIILLLEAARRKVEIKAAVDRIFGGLFGIITGFVAAASLLVILSASPNMAQEIESTKYAPQIRQGLLKFYEYIERHNFTLPKMVSLPTAYIGEFSQEVTKARLLKINFTKFEGFTCLNCGEKVEFEGYFVINRGIVPKLVCEQCGRTSDGCQTYEGYHKLYNACPVELARKGMRFDCGRWPNRTWITPTGPCPIDNDKLEMLLWRAPIKY